MSLANNITNAKIWRGNMFRLGLKKEEKDMISYTLSELKELRAELSVLRNALARISPDERHDIQAGQAEEGEVGAVTPASGRPGGGPEEECFPEGEVSGGEGDAPAGGAKGEILCKDAGIECKEASLEENRDAPLEECMEAPGVEAVYSERTAVPRDWAVVNLTGAKRPWWKFWEPAQRITKRSV